ncbi:hypothetical protein CE91St6_01660 [Phocaeicola dorei]|uniref:Uncharacterized protein n=1 Tax=Phocaeicola dorei TaxID=357276 RepID=A0AA37KCI1_9BACT|nr:hypothetical protein CE91St6_01660 [Phocaeicola dorei]GKH79282.1 hypothetical protein CE91St7_01660 [Phocaeicola dorei]
MAKEHAGNTVDCYIYTVEKSLDSYKFNLLHNKQVFINQLKSHNLATRTIDEGAMDENGGVSFSEYVAILSDNNDLLEKAKLEKKLAVLESERLAYHRNKGNAKGKLHEKVSEIEKNETFIERFTRDWEYLNRVAPTDTATGLRPNPLKLDGVESGNIEILADRLSAINRNARTEDDYMKIGTLFDFRILVRSEKVWDGSTESLQNKFMVEGLDGIKYTYNNGYIAKDPKLAVMNFINALERIPGMIEKRKKDNTELEKDLPVLREIVSTLWPKEGEIKELTEELATLNRKYSINSLVYWVTYVHNVVYSFYRSMIYCYINSTQRCAGSIEIDIIPTNGADKRKFSPFAPYFPVTNVIKRYFYPYFPAIIGIKGYSFPYFPYLSGIMKIKTALYSLFSRLDWHKTVVFPCLGEIYEGIRSLSWEIPVT